MMSLDNKLQFDLGAECDKAARILEGFLHPFGSQQLRETEVGKRKLNTIPGEVIKRARGLAVFTVLKGGFKRLSGFCVLTSGGSWVHVLGQDWLGGGVRPATGRELECTELYSYWRCVKLL